MNDLRGLWRGKSVDPEEWIEGYFAGYFLNERGENTPHILRSDNGDLEEIIPETLGECTGLTDKNGVKIFEGDILRCVSESWGDSYITNIFASGNTLCVDVEHQDYDYSAMCQADYIWKNEGYEIEVIGNIFDNPELLEGGENNG